MLAMLALSGLALAGCGGGAEAPAADPAAAAGGDPAAAGTTTTAQGTADAVSAQTQANAGETPGTTVADPAAAGATGDPAAAGTATPPPKEPIAVAISPGSQIVVTADTPTFFSDALGKKTIVFYAYQPGTLDGTRLLREVVKGISPFKSKVVFIRYTPAEYENFGDLPEKLGVFDLPTVVIINRAGKLQNAQTMFWPAELIAASIQSAEAVPPANVSPEDAPPTAEADPLSTMVSETGQSAAGGTATS